MFEILNVLNFKYCDIHILKNKMRRFSLNESDSEKQQRNNIQLSFYCVHVYKFLLCTIFIWVITCWHNLFGLDILQRWSVVRQVWHCKLIHKSVSKQQSQRALCGQPNADLRIVETEMYIHTRFSDFLNALTWVII